MVETETRDQEEKLFGCDQPKSFVVDVLHLITEIVRSVLFFFLFIFVFGHFAQSSINVSYTRLQIIIFKMHTKHYHTHTAQHTHTLSISLDAKSEQRELIENLNKNKNEKNYGEIVEDDHVSTSFTHLKRGRKRSENRTHPNHIYIVVGRRRIKMKCRNYNHIRCLLLSIFFVFFSPPLLGPEWKCMKRKY